MLLTYIAQLVLMVYTQDETYDMSLGYKFIEVNFRLSGSVHNPLDLSEEEWDSTMTTNLTGTWLVSKYVCIHMRDAKQGGSIINISSISGLNRGQLPGSLAYSASKTGVVTLTKVNFVFVFQIP